MKTPISAFTFAKLLISFNPDLFDDNTPLGIAKMPYKGGLTLDRLLQIAQMIYIAKFGKLLFKETFVAFLNGGFIPSLHNDWRKLVNESHDQKNNIQISDDLSTNKWLSDYAYFLINWYQNFTPRQLVYTCQADPAWKITEPYIGLGNSSRTELKMLSHQRGYQDLFKKVLQSLNNSPLLAK